MVEFCKCLKKEPGGFSLCLTSEKKNEILFLLMVHPEETRIL